MPLYVTPVPAQFLSANSAQFTPGAGSSGTYYTLSGNSVTLTPGSWQLHGGAIFTNNGTTPAYTSVILAYSTANGANTGPSLDAGLNLVELPQPANSESFVQASICRITVTTNTTIFLVPQIQATVTANARITINIYAELVSR